MQSTNAPTKLKMFLRPILVKLLSCGGNSNRTVSRSCKHRGREFCGVKNFESGVLPGGVARLQRFGRKFVGRDAAARDLRLPEALGADRDDAPFVQARGDPFDLRV